jgi:SAM-dependent methyltransferase
MKKIRLCPVCEGSKRRGMLKINGFEIVKCTSCKHVFVNNINLNTSSTLDASTKDFDITQTHFRHHMIVKLIENKFPEINDSSENVIRVAEIGSGIGRLGYLLLSKKALKYCGFEPSVERYTYSKMHNINVKNEIFKENGSKWDVIVMDNVLEHVANPREIYNMASMSLNKGGIFIVIVPNRYDVRRFLPSFRDEHYWIPRWHINYFSMSDLQYLSKINNMSIHKFGTDTLDGGSQFLKFKTLLDGMGIQIGGLYTYSVKL